MTSSLARQRGAVLVTVLVLLMVMTLLGLVGIRTTLLEERMSASLYDRSLAFQAAFFLARRVKPRAGPMRCGSARSLCC